VLKACKAPDGSYWALQSWVRLKPGYGGPRGATDLHLSHWRGPLAQLVIRARGTARRLKAPGVTPDVMWAADDIGPFDQVTQDQLQALERSWGDPKCRN
jgi:hypothetical protein